MRRGRPVVRPAAAPGHWCDRARSIRRDGPGRVPAPERSKVLRRTGTRTKRGRGRRQLSAPAGHPRLRGASRRRCQRGEPQPWLAPPRSSPARQPSEPTGTSCEMAWPASQPTSCRRTSPQHLAQLHPEPLDQPPDPDHRGTQQPGRAHCGVRRPAPWYTFSLWPAMTYRTLSPGVDPDSCQGVAVARIALHACAGSKVGIPSVPSTRLRPERHCLGRARHVDAMSEGVKSHISASLERSRRRREAGPLGPDINSSSTHAASPTSSSLERPNRRSG